MSEYLNKQALYFPLKQLLKEHSIVVQDPLFHATAFAKAQQILQTGFKARAGGPGNSGYYDNAVCFSRNLAYVLKGFFGGSQVVFIVDKQELQASGFKTYAFDYNFVRFAEVADAAFKRYRSMAKSKERDFEYEERVSRSTSYVTRMKQYRAAGRDVKELEIEMLKQPETIILPRHIKAVLMLGEVTRLSQSMENSYSLDKPNEKLYKEHIQLEALCASKGIPIIKYRKEKDNERVEFSKADTELNYSKWVTSELAHKDVSLSWERKDGIFYLEILFNGIPAEHLEGVQNNGLPPQVVRNDFVGRHLWNTKGDKVALYLYSRKVEDMEDLSGFVMVAAKDSLITWKNYHAFLKEIKKEEAYVE